MKVTQAFSKFLVNYSLPYVFWMKNEAVDGEYSICFIILVIILKVTHT